MSLQDKIIKSTGIPKCHSTLLDGESGTGKTDQYRALRKAGFNPLYASAEGKLATIADLEPDVWPIKSFDFPLTPSDSQLIKASGYGTSDMLALYHYLKNEDHPYDCLFMDSGMRIGEEMCLWLTKTTMSEKGNVDALRGYGLFADKMNMAMKAFHSLTDVGCKKPIHFVVTWGVAWSQDMYGRRKVQPIVEGKKFLPKLPYIFDNVFYMFGKEDVSEDGKSSIIRRYMGTTPTDTYYAKYSGGGVELPDVIDVTGHKLGLGDVLKKLTGVKDEK